MFAAANPATAVGALVEQAVTAAKVTLGAKAVVGNGGAVFIAI